MNQKEEWEIYGEFLFGIIHHQGHRSRIYKKTVCIESFNNINKVKNIISKCNSNT